MYVDHSKISGCFEIPGHPDKIGLVLHLIMRAERC
jgi:hypothetical protein